MASSVSCSVPVYLLLFLFLLQLGTIYSSSSHFHKDECNYLTEFLNSVNYLWNPEENSGNCCSWSGVKCHKVHGYVIGLDLSDRDLYGPLNSNSSLFRLAHLRSLDLSFNDFNNSIIPDKLGNLHSLKILYLRGSQLSGVIPSSLGNLTRLIDLDLTSNEFTRQDFSSMSWIARIAQLRYLDLRAINLVGGIPFFITNMTELMYLRVDNNELNGTVDMGDFARLKSLDTLTLSQNNFWVLPESSVNHTLPVLRELRLDSCMLSSFPSFLHNLRNLNWLDLSNNGLSGEIPKWFMNTSKSLQFLDLSHNSLSGFEEKRQVPLPWSDLAYIDLRDNKLEGSPPIPPDSHSLWFYSVSTNNLSGNLPEWMCNLNASAIQKLDISFNNLSGSIPLCLHKLMNTLVALNMKNNSFIGQIPELWESNCSMEALDLSFNQLQGKVPNSLANCKPLRFLALRNNQLTGRLPTWFGSLPELMTIDLSQNRLQGQLPKSLAKCKKLVHLSVWSNQINDSFPFWLGNLPELKVLSLKSNRFHGLVRNNGARIEFQRLQILDLSSNSFSGNMPTELLKNLKAMKVATESQDEETELKVINLSLYNFDFTIGINNKGNGIEYRKIPDAFVVLDLSNNKFIGEIFEVLGNLQGLRMLNLSRNILKGRIPSSLGNLSVVESLDLSHNKLTGRIPPEVSQLHYLQTFNLSFNRLEGPIPRGRHFDLFDNSSYLQNVKLCGYPLLKECVRKISPSPEEDSDANDNIDWSTVMMGYACGIVVGLSIGYVFTTLRHEWFVKILEKRQRFNKRMRSRKNQTRRSYH